MRIAFVFVCLVVFGCGDGGGGGSSETSPGLPQKNRSPVVLLFGDSILDNLSSPVCSTLEPFNRSDGGLMAVHAIAKFKVAVDVIKPAIIILQIGTNDLAQRNLLDVPLSAYLDAMRDMVGYARVRNLTVILCSLTPAYGDAQKALRPPEVIQEYNVALYSLAMDFGAWWVDLYGPMDKEEYFVDGLHPSAMGYAVMEIEICKAIYGGDK